MKGLHVLESSQLSLILGTNILSMTGELLRVVGTRLDGKRHFLTVEAGLRYCGVHFSNLLLTVDEEMTDFMAAL